MSDKKKVTEITTPVGTSEYQSKIEYQIHFNSPVTGHGGVIAISGIHDTDLGPEAQELFKLLVENGWVSNPVMGRNVHTIRHTSFHAELANEKKPPPAKV